MSFLGSIVRDARARSWMRSPAVPASAPSPSQLTAPTPGAQIVAGEPAVGRPLIESPAVSTPADNRIERSRDTRRDPVLGGETSVGVVDPSPPVEPVAPRVSDLSNPVTEARWSNTGREQAAHKASGDTSRVENDGVFFARPLDDATETQLGTKEDESFDPESAKAHSSFGLTIPDLPTIGTVSTSSARRQQSLKTARRSLDSEGSEGSRSEPLRRSRRRVRQTPPGTATPSPDSLKLPPEGTTDGAEERAVTPPAVPKTASESVEEADYSRTRQATADPTPAKAVEPTMRWAAPRRQSEAVAASRPAPEPSLRIGQIDVIVAAPEAPRAASTAPPPTSSNASRCYLRSL